ncbi:MAG: hypothetical protein C5B51_08545 [Terriglobia bacterium]|nr:MAG: hypothetical protein C5B51_08545 [Terriglobia bacterium]
MITTFDSDGLRSLRRLQLWGLLAVALLIAAPSHAQSTFASVLGTVRDPSGGSVAACKILVENTGTSLRRTAVTDGAGNYTVPNLEPGGYTIRMEAPGFQAGNYRVELTARQTMRVDGQLTVASQVETVNVVAEAAAVINTEVSNIAETKSGRELVDLPVAIATRSTGSTSPMSTLTTQPGVQTDPAGGISVAGSKPSMLSMSIDGISSIGPRTAGPLVELFPSFNSIAEIRVSEVNNAAEFGGISDITTISKSGTNGYHGGVFENFQNDMMNARNTFSAVVPRVRMNNFGAYVGGPVGVPHLYSGHDRTFFFASYEALRLPKSQVLTESVPSLALRNGDLSVYPYSIRQPGTNVPFPDNRIPISQISPIALNALNYLFPLPNTGSPTSVANNFTENLPTPISSDQGDMRIDQTITSKNTAFARFTYKHRDVTVAPSPGGSPTPSGSALIGAISTPEIDFGLTVADNYIISPTVVNEVRLGFNGNHTATTYGITSDQMVSKLGLVGIPQPYSVGGNVPNFNITGFQQTGGSAATKSRNFTFQILETLTWTKGTHALKFGGDWRHLTGFYANVFASSRLGQYSYNGSVVGSNGNGYIGNPFAAFLLGVPDKVQLATVIQPDGDVYADHLAFFVQDDWKVTPRLTLNYGLRWEYHPMFKDRYLNGTNFLPDYLSIINGVPIRGAAVISNQEAFKIENPLFAAAIAPTPVLTAAQAGIPESLRFSSRTDFAPRIGFAWRPFSDGKTVIRGGYGRFIEGSLGSLYSAAWGIHTSYVSIFTNTITNGQASLTFPYPFPSNLAQPGVYDFEQGFDLHYKDPWIQQWNLTFERDLGKGVGIRLSYDGSHGSDLNVQENLNQLPANTIGFNAAKNFAPYPVFAKIGIESQGGWSNYNAMTVSTTKRSSSLQFQASYTFTRNLSNAQSWNPTSFATEAGGLVTDRFNLGLDYGNVSFSRQHRFLGTFLYQLPFGKKGALMKSANGFVDRVVGGWELAGVLTFQSGPFMQVVVPGADPSGTGFPNLIGGSNGRADMVSGVPLYPATQTWSRWVNPAAFAVPANNIGRFGNAPVGNVVGPGTQAVSMSLMKAVAVRESVRVQIGAQVGNLLNHPNYAPPNMVLNTAAFGTLSALQTAEGAGPRQIQLTGRVTF